MPLTSMLGTIESQPGQTQPGYFCASTATWRGPYVGVINPIPGGQLTPTNGVTATIVNVADGYSFIVAPAIASQLANSGRTWWEFH